MKNGPASAPAKSPRLPRYQHFSELSFTYEGSKDTLRVHPPNISAKGMFIHTTVAFPEGSVLKLHFRLAQTGVEIDTRCEVRYCLAGVGFGVEFVGLPPQFAHAIEAEIGPPKAGKRRKSQRPVRS